MLQVVALELDLIFDLVDQRLRQEDADQLRDRERVQKAHQLAFMVRIYSSGSS